MALKLSDDLLKADEYMNSLIDLEVENKSADIGFDDKTQSFNAWLNREIWDHDDELIKADGWDLSVHDLNPVMMWVHKYDEKPLGNSLWTKRKLKEDPPGLLWRPSFTTETQEGVDTYKLYKARVLRAFSAGFKQKEIDKTTDKKGRSIYTKTLLLEGSAVPIPANFLSLTLALENDFVKSVILKKSFDDILSRTDSRLFQTDMTDNEFEYIEKSFGTVKDRKKVIPKQMADPDDISVIWKKATEIQAIQKNIGSGYVTICIDRIEVSQTDPEYQLWETRNLERKDKHTIDASEFEDDHDIDIEDDDLEQVEVDIEALDEVEVDIEQLADVGDVGIKLE